MTSETNCALRTQWQQVDMHVVVLVASATVGEKRVSRVGGSAMFNLMCGF